MRNGGVGYWNCPNAGPARLAACTGCGAHRARRQADPHRRRAQRAEERKRRGSTLLLGKPSQPSRLAGVSCIRRARLTILPAQEAVTRGPEGLLQHHVDLVTCGFSRLMQFPSLVVPACDVEISMIK